jgi:hypothetical protein
LKPFFVIFGHKNGFSHDLTSFPEADSVSRRIPPHHVPVKAHGSMVSSLQIKDSPGASLHWNINVFWAALAFP